MLATLVTAVISGLRGELVRVEVDVAPGLPVCHIVGLPDAALSEARERVRGAIRNSGFECLHLLCECRSAAMPTAIAYLRRSSANTANGAGRVSFETQQAAVVELARRHGDEPELIVEWGRSGADRAGAFGGTVRGGKRRVYRELRERIAAGDVTTIYAYSLSRLARSTRELLDLAEACATTGATIRLAKEGSLDFGTPSGRLYLTVLAAVSTFEAEVARERAMDRVALARESGRYLGQAPTGWCRDDDGKLVHGDDRIVVEAVLDAFRATGAYRQAARLLNEAGEVRPPKAEKWSATVVRTIASRELGTRTAPARRGSRTHPTDPLARLLVCGHCGGMLTPTRQRYTTKAGPAEHRAWRCHRAGSDSAHPRPVNIAENTILPALMAESARLRVPVERVRLAEERRADLVALDGRRARLVDALEAGTLTRGELEPRLAAIEQERLVLEAAAAAVELPRAVDWSWSTDALGSVLASLWKSVTVHIGTGTIEAEWQVPEWRS